MITDWQVQHRDGVIILGLAVEHAVLDVVSDVATLKACIAVLRAPHHGLVTRRLGGFGPYDVSLNVHHDESVSLFLDGPRFSEGRGQSAAIWVDKDHLCRILDEVAGG